MTHRNATKKFVPACTLGLGFLLASCGGTRSSEPPQPVQEPVYEDEVDGSEPIWLEASPALERQIEIHLAKLPWLQTLDERVEIIEWFRDVGEPAYAQLLVLVDDPRPKVSGTALAALGATRDPRLVEPLRAAAWPDESQTDLCLERARAHMQLGDWSHIDVLINGLEDPRPMTRAICARSLRRATQMTFGFDASAEEGARSESVAKWRAWAEARTQDEWLR